MSDVKMVSDREAKDTFAFLEDIRVGTGPLNAALAVGWSPAKIRRLMKDEEFILLMSCADEMRLESVEKTLWELAQRGHFKAIQMILFNKRANDWRDIKHIQVDKRETLEVGVVVSVKQAAIELLREHGVEALQPVQTAIEVKATG